MLVRFANGQAHAVTVYGWIASSKAFAIYDNNFPGESVTLSWDATNGFTGYSKAGAYPQISSFSLMPLGMAMEGPEFEALYQGAEAGWSVSKFDQIAFTTPAPDTNGKYIIPGQQDLTVSGAISPAGKPTAVVYSWNGSKLGVAPITNNQFSFTIPAAKVVGYSNTISLITTNDPKNVFFIGGYADLPTYIQGAVFFTNPGFETGDWTGWTNETHLWLGGCCGVPPLKSAIVDNSLMALDPLDPNLSTVYTGRFSARVNNDDPDYHISSVSQSVTVPQGSAPQIRFYWSAVLEDPGHPPEAQPYVDILVTDDTAGTQLYNRHFYSNDPSYSGWITVYPNGSYDPWQVINWQPVVIDLSGAIGHQVTVKITAADCGYGGHGGYAYFDGDVQ
jgi:hypothetical protein